MGDEKLIAQINTDTLSENLWQLVCIPSPTGREKKAALHFADMLELAGAEVEIDPTLPDSPNVIGRLKGKRNGPVLQLAGHIDHVDVPHPQPKRDKKIISGRGSADMKNGLAGILEIVRILKTSGCDFAGEILVTVYGLHEAPLGSGAGLSNLIAKGIKGDAAIVFEGPDDAAAVAANGMGIWNVSLHLKEPACHELSVSADRPDLLGAVLLITDAIRKKDAELRNAANPFPLLFRESLFIGQVHYGDFYNRAPCTAFMQGTRRWHPDKSYEQIKDDFDSLLKNAAIPKSVIVDKTWIYVGDSYQIETSEKIVQSLTKAYEAVYKKKCPIRGHSSVTDVSKIVRQGRIPAVLCGFGTETGHCDYEFVEIERIKRCCTVALRTVLNYLDTEDME
ncbi:MAG: M20/M25/M40 family metallo-hydrolase [Sedimentisphaerales bacterium]